VDRLLEFGSWNLGPDNSPESAARTINELRLPVDPNCSGEIRHDQ
jgi:hypothetical protein